MTDFKIEYVDELSNNIDERVNQGHIADETAHGVICDYKKFHFVIKDVNSNTIGTLTAYTAYSEIYIDDIWIEPNYRNIGLARKLIEHLEHYFKDKGYNNINLVTSQFQAPGFYKKCGFQLEFIRENIFNPKLTKFFFIKYFDNTNQYRGMLNKDQP